jgi:phosphatidylglycerophosphate synthase
MGLADQLTLVRVAAVPLVVVLYVADFDGHLRLAALERGVVMHARDLGKLKTWSQATAAAVGGFAAAGAWSNSVAWWALLVSLVLTWLSGLDYARIAPGLLRGRAVAP